MLGLHRRGVDQHESDVGRLIGAIAPGVIGAALDQHVAGRKLDIALVHQRVDFAGQHDRVVGRAGLVKTGMARRAAVERGNMAGAVVAGRALLRERGEALAVRRVLDNGEHGSVLGRRESERMIGELGVFTDI